MVSKIPSAGKKVAEVTVQIGPQFLNLFSEHLYSSPNKAFEELVSNSWDAGARHVYIRVPDELDDENAAIWVLDDGMSMDITGFRALWAVATSARRAQGAANGRQPIGKFGVGKLATYLLAHELTYVCRAADKVTRIITMDYRLIDRGEKGKLHIDPIPLQVRELIDRDSGLKAGIMVGNSEVGTGSISIEPFVYRLACTNDLVVSEEQSFRHPHTRLTVDELRKGTALAISIALKVAACVLVQFLKAREEPVPDPVETIRQLAEARKLSRKFADEVASSYAAEPEPTRFGVINAFTRAAQKLGPLQQIEMERFAGTLLEAKL